MSFLEERKALTREKRLMSLSHFNGNLEGLIDETSGTEIKQRIRTFTQIHRDETIAAFDVLSKIEDAFIIINGAIGCGSLGLAVDDDKSFNWIATDLNERDTILGGDDKLREAVERAYEEHHPKVIFIIGTPVVAINNDDINSVILELEDELGVSIISIYTDGFKSKTPVTGYDIVTHSLLKYVVKKEVTDRDDFINIISFSEGLQDVVEISKIFKALNIKFQVIPRFSSIEEIKKASLARASVVLNPEEGEYLAKELEEVFGVPYISSEAPIGFRGTKNFILKLANFLRIEDDAIAYIDEIENELTANFNNDLLTDKKIFVDAPLSKIPALTRYITNLGGEVVGFGSPFVDLENRKQLKRLDFLKNSVSTIIGNGQLFEKANEISKDQVDIFVTDFEGYEDLGHEGVVIVNLRKQTSYGFAGVDKLSKAFTKAIRVLENDKKIQKESIYKPSWKKRSGNWYVKQEVS
ncbi:nitrogenase molybdenum-iron protein alpha chain [Pseudobutyrivibrio sp. YE44]|uniref:nitrogenase component 1 n=1 Tax=Pseudobutyrivibrio sp. YE44 TaxID=1520802 RepID=UPI0008824075|nr:nitrogenase component 1 [Pseudobutyrivibrio sp. YE44]SDB14808.1 nitrogenase molybdenum-iron protein alpha chain [Pseudobutyrivibrio sp. YE44]